ncbi:hypothetical protein HGRIS_012040 [Hohenbuehelia grisea]|uniref:Uncharacterized protein n=1 Tax=Hohenbuehelia grisea TaxID=104357 RepID=A0ABR3IR37_9AGAR
MKLSTALLAFALCATQLVAANPSPAEANELANASEALTASNPYEAAKKPNPPPPVKEDEGGDDDEDDDSEEIGDGDEEGGDEDEDDEGEGGEGGNGGGNGPKCTDSAAYKAAKAEADRLRGIANAAKQRLEALRAASAKARADPRYVYQAGISPYHLISGAEKEFNQRDAAAKAAEAKANAICNGTAPPPEENKCADSAEFKAADAAARAAEAAAEAARKRLQALQAASAKARADPRYVYVAGVSPYHLIKGAEKDLAEKEATARTLRARATAICTGGPVPPVTPVTPVRPNPPVNHCANSAAFKNAHAAARRALTQVNAAKRRLHALRIASAKARADPRYVYHAVSPYHLIKGAEKVVRERLATYRTLRNRANAVCGRRGRGHGRGRGRRPAARRCSAAGQKARAEAHAARRRLVALRVASAKARADPRYVYQAKSPYHMIKGAERALAIANAKARKLRC